MWLTEDEYNAFCSHEQPCVVVVKLCQIFTISYNGGKMAAVSIIWFPASAGQ